MSENNTELTASQKRAADDKRSRGSHLKPASVASERERLSEGDFVKTFSLEALRDRLPLQFPVLENVPPSPKRQYRSDYRYLGPDDLADLTMLATMTLFEIALRLIDFSPLRDYPSG